MAGSKENLKTGLAGEFRVMAELLLRGHNPAKSYLNEGADIVLENGLRVEVKAGRRCHGFKRRVYMFSLKGGGRKRIQDLSHCNFVIVWCIDDDCFFIIPTDKITGTVIAIDIISPRNKYYPYLSNWDLLRVKE